MKGNSMIMTVVIAVVVGAIAFYGGMKYDASQNTKSQSSLQGGAGGNGGYFRRGGGSNGQAVRGQVVSSDANSITVKLSDGSSKIINTSGSTMFTQSSKASASDVKNGTTVAAFGTNNSDGSITATNVQINPMGGFGGRGGSGGNGGSNSYPAPSGS